MRLSRDLYSLTISTPDGDTSWQMYDDVTDITFTTSRYGGFGTMTFIANMNPSIDYPQFQQDNNVVLYRGLQILFEGRIENPQRNFSTSSISFSITCQGYITDLKNDACFRRVYADNDVSQWEDWQYSDGAGKFNRVQVTDLYLGPRLTINIIKGNIYSNDVCDYKYTNTSGITSEAKGPDCAVFIYWLLAGALGTSATDIDTRTLVTEAISQVEFTLQVSHTGSGATINIADWNIDVYLTNNPLMDYTSDPSDIVKYNSNEFRSILHWDGAVTTNKIYTVNQSWWAANSPEGYGPTAVVFRMAAVNSSYTAPVAGWASLKYICVFGASDCPVSHSPEVDGPYGTVALDDVISDLVTPYADSVVADSAATNVSLCAYRTFTDRASVLDEVNQAVDFNYGFWDNKTFIYSDPSNITSEDTYVVGMNDSSVVEWNVNTSYDQYCNEVVVRYYTLKGRVREIQLFGTVYGEITRRRALYDCGDTRMEDQTALAVAKTYLAMYNCPVFSGEIVLSGTISSETGRRIPVETLRAGTLIRCLDYPYSLQTVLSGTATGIVTPPFYAVDTLTYPWTFQTLPPFDVPHYGTLLISGTSYDFSSGEATLTVGRGLDRISELTARMALQSRRNFAKWLV